MTMLLCTHILMKKGKMRIWPIQYQYHSYWMSSVMNSSRVKKTGGEEEKQGCLNFNIFSQFIWSMITLILFMLRSSRDFTSPWLCNSTFLSDTDMWHNDKLTYKIHHLTSFAYLQSFLSFPLTKTYPKNTSSDAGEQKAAQIVKLKI